MPTSWVLQELEIHSLTTNTAIISKHMKGDSGKWSILAGKLRRNVSPTIQWGDKKGHRVGRPEILVYKYQRQVCDGIVRGAFS